MAPYRQISLWSGDAFTKMCPRGIETRRCRRIPTHQLSSTLESDKEEFKIPREDILTNFTSYSEAVRTAKCTRLARLSCCRLCDKDDNLRLFRDRMIEDLVERNAARGPAIPAQNGSSPCSTCKRGGATPASNPTQMDNENTAFIKLAPLSSTKAELQALRDECYRLAKRNEELAQKLLVREHEAEKHRRLYQKMKGYFDTLQYDTEDLEAQGGGKKSKTMYLGLKNLIEAAVTRAQKIADSAYVKKEFETEDSEDDEESEDEDEDEDDESSICSGSVWT